MNQRTKFQVLDDVAQQYSRKDIDLSSRILSRVQKEKVSMKNLKFALSAVLTVAVIMATLFAIPTTATAMKRIFSFIPGIGLVNDDVPMRVLKDSAKVEQNGTTVSVLQGVVDSQNTTLVYQVENLPDFPSPIDSQISDVCRQLPELKLPDGSIVSGQTETGKNWLSGYSRRIAFPALPVDVNSAQLVFSCFEHGPLQTDAPKMEITLDFIQAAEDAAVYPLVDLPTPEPSSSTPVTGEGSFASDIQLVVERYVQTDENLILFGNLKSLSGNTPLAILEEKAFHLFDSNGVEIPLTEDPSISYPSDLTSSKNSYSWTYLIESTYAAGQATMTVDSAWIRVNDIASFSFDIGINPQPGQKWKLDQSVNIAGREIQIQTAEINPKGNGISFAVVKPDDISNINLMDFDHALLGGGGGDESYGFTYRDGLPSGEITITIESALVQIPGPWETKIDLPESALSVVSVEPSAACVTHSTWQEALNESSALPEGLSGTLGINGYRAPDFIYRVMTTSLDGTNEKIYSKGRDISLSFDGRQAVYNDDDTGLQLMNLDTQAVTPLVNTGRNDRGPIWAPDGTKIAFTRGPASGLIGGPGPYSIVIANPDGTQQESIVDDGEANTVMAWLPDGESLVYTVAGSERTSVNSINISTREITQLFETGSSTNVSISPDGKRVAYLDMLPGERYAIYTANMEDPTKSNLLVDAAPVVMTRPFWSPNGEWLIVSVYDESVSDEFSLLALINADTCQIIPLMNLSGYVTSWNP